MKQIYSVSQVNQYIKNLFVRDGLLSRLYVKGEVSNCTYHGSGHIYFTLKDRSGQISCVMFAGQSRGLKFKLEAGQSVVVLGNVGVYEVGGRYQVYASEIVLDGQGILYEQYEKLKKDLKEEGLFDGDKKKPIPNFAQKVGIVTADTGAVIQDIINVASRRNPYVSLYLYPSRVQGEGASTTIVKGIEFLDRQGMDIIIVGRGGGSIEDLWAFNEENLARAIYKAKTPIISAVGHETDVTIADFVADLRAPTPSAAAELAVYDYMQFIDELKTFHSDLTRAMMEKIKNIQSKIREYNLKIEYASPLNQIKQKRQYLIDLEEKLTNRMNKILVNNKHQVQIYGAKLEGLSPLNKLQQGYAYVVDEEHKSVRSVKQVSEDDNITISLIDGQVTSKITKITELTNRAQ